jgi:hypothetical protein
LRALEARAVAVRGVLQVAAQEISDLKAQQVAALVCLVKTQTVRLV